MEKHKTSSADVQRTRTITIFIVNRVISPVIYLSSPEPNFRWILYNRQWFVIRHRQHFQRISPLKLLGQLKSNYMWSLHGVGEQMFVHNVWIIWPRWPPCQYMVKTFENLPQESNSRWPWNLLCSIKDSTKFVQMMTLGCPWPILQQGQIQSLGLLYGKRANSGFFWSYSSLTSKLIFAVS